MRKQNLIIILFSVLFFTNIFNVNGVYAKDHIFNTDNKEYMLEPAWENSRSVRVYLSRTGNTLFPKATIRVSKIPTDVKGIMYLESNRNGKWSTIKSWSFSSTKSTSISKRYVGSKGNKYRARLSVTVNGENINSFSSTVTL